MTEQNQDNKVIEDTSLTDEDKRKLYEAQGLTMEEVEQRKADYVDRMVDKKGQPTRSPEGDDSE